MLFDQFIALIPQLKTSTLAGDKAHLEVAPYRDKQFMKVKENPKEAAVLALLFPINNITYFALIKRPVYNGNHSGQVAFPGGKKENTDKNLKETALREAFEETNINPKKVEIIKQLSRIYIPPSNFYVSSFLGITATTPQFSPEEREVDYVIKVKLSELLKDGNLSSQQIKLQNGASLNSPTFVFNNEIVWGATAMILNELKYLIKNKIAK